MTSTACDARISVKIVLSASILDMQANEWLETYPSNSKSESRINPSSSFKQRWVGFVELAKSTYKSEEMFLISEPM